MRPIVHPTDFSPASRPAFAAAIAMAKATHSALVTWALGRLAPLTARARAARVRAVSIIREGAEADQIVRLARARRASTVVMGTHGRSGMKRVAFGSVAARVLRQAPCPVLTVRGR